MNVCRKTVNSPYVPLGKPFHASLTRAQCRDACARLPQVAIEHRRRVPFRDVSGKCGTHDSWAQDRIRSGALPSGSRWSRGLRLGGIFFRGPTETAWRSPWRAAPEEALADFVSTAEPFVLASVREEGAGVSARGAIETPSALPPRAGPRPNAHRPIRTRRTNLPVCARS